MLVLVPALAPPDAAKIVSLTEQYAAVNNLPVALVLAVQYTETHWGTNMEHVSPADHGLMGLRVDRFTRPEYLGRERELLNVETNIRLGTEALVYWRRYHHRHCPPPQGTHPWYSHYQWGNVVGNATSGLKVERMYRRLLRQKGKS